MHYRFALSVAVGLLFFCTATRAGEETPIPLTILFAGDAEGEYAPCGCPGSPMGGFARRATVLRQVRAEGQPVLMLDTGNALLRGSLVRIQPDETTKRHAAFMADLLAAAGTQAIAVGPRDLWAATADGLRKLDRKSGVAWLSANIIGPDGDPLFPSHVRLRAGNLRVAVVGLTQPQPAVVAGSGVTFMDPIAAARAVVGSLRPESDLIVVLCNLLFEHQEALRDIPGIDIILAGTPEVGVPDVSDDRAPCVVRVHGLGRTLGRVDLRIVLRGGSPPVRSLRLEQRFRRLTGIRDELETLKTVIVEEEGRLDAERYEREGAFLRGKLEVLEGEIRAEGAAGSVFAYQELALVESVPPDPKVQRRIEAYERTSAGRGSGPRPGGVKESPAGTARPPPSR